MKSFLLNAAVYAIGSFLLEAASVVLLPIYLHCLSPEEYGTLELLNRIGTIVVIGLMANGFRMAALTFYQQATNELDRRQTVAAAVLALFVVVLVGILISIVSVPGLARWLGSAGSDLLLFGMITVVLESAIIVPLAIIQARIQSVRYITVTFSMFLARVALIVYFVVFLELGLWGILISRAVVAIVFGAALNALELRDSSSHIDWTTLRGMFKFALPFLPSGFLAFFIDSGDRFFLMKQYGEHEVGIYSLSYRLASAATLFTFIPLYKVWSAKMYAAAERLNAEQVFGLMFWRLMVILAFVGLTMSIFAEDLLHLMGGHDYIAATRYLPILLLSMLFMSASDLMDSGLYVTRNTRYKPAIKLVSGLVIFIAYTTLIPRFGGLGAAWATLIGYLVQVIVTWRVTQWLFYVRYDWPRLLVIFAATVATWTAHELYPTASYRSAVDIALILGWCACVGLVASSDERRIVMAALRRIVDRLKWGFEAKQPDNL